jgi:adenylate cyclase
MDQHVTFGSFRFEPGTARLWENGAEVKLTRKAAMVLGALLERPGAPVSKQELFANVWRGTVVSDDALVTCIQELRKALGDDSKQPLYIETRHRLGYRFAAPVAPVMAQRDSAANTTAIAVLPFTDMSEKRDQDYLCEGLAEELIDALTHVEGLRVVARTSSFLFRGDHDLREVGRKLNVGSLLEGSVRKSGDRLRVTVQLIDVATGFHKW